MSIAEETKDSQESRSEAAEELFEAFSALRTLRRHPGLGRSFRPAEFHLLHLLSHGDAGGGGEDGFRVGDLADLLRVKPPTVSHLVEALVSRGLVERRRDGSDRRSVRVHLSAEGRRLNDVFRQRALAETAALTAYLGLEDSRLLAALIRRATSFFASRQGAGEAPSEASAPDASA